MRSQEFDDKSSSKLDDHFIEELNRRIGSETDLCVQIRKSTGLVKEKISSPEASLLLRDIMDIEYYPSHYLTEEENLFSSVIKRPQENTENYSRYKLLLEEYIKTDVKKFFNMDFNDYLNLTPYERKYIIEVSKKYAEELVEMMKKSEKEANKKAASTQKAFNLNAANDEVSELLGFR